MLPLPVVLALTHRRCTVWRSTRPGIGHVPTFFSRRLCGCVAPSRVWVHRICAMALALLLMLMLLLLLLRWVAEWQTRSSAPA
jgi:hypothetical protein